VAGAVVAAVPALLAALLLFDPQPDNNAADTPATTRTLNNFIFNSPCFF
jgi:hypothetical protein